MNETSVSHRKGLEKPFRLLKVYSVYLLHNYSHAKRGFPLLFDKVVHADMVQYRQDFPQWMAMQPVPTKGIYLCRSSKEKLSLTRIVDPASKSLPVAIMLTIPPVLLSDAAESSLTAEEEGYKQGLAMMKKGQTEWVGQEMATGFDGGYNVQS